MNITLKLRLISWMNFNFTFSHPTFPFRALHLSPSFLFFSFAGLPWPLTSQTAVIKLVKETVEEL